MILLMLVMVVLTLHRLDESLWIDEQYTYWYAGAAQYGPIGIVESVQRVAANLWQAPVYYLMVLGWGRFVGWSELALRVLSVFAGVLSVALTYQLGRRLFNQEVGLYAGVLLGTGAYFLNYLHDARTYTLMVLLSVVMLWLYIEIMRTPARRWLYGALALSIGLQLYTHYFTIFAIGGLGLYHLAFRFRKPGFWPVFASFAVGGALFLPWLPVLIDGLRLSTGDPRAVSNLSPLAVINELLFQFSNGSRALTLLLAVLALRTFTHDKNLIFMTSVFGMGLGLAILASRFFPALTDMRYLLFLFPMLALIAGVGIANLRQMGLSPVLVLLVWGGLSLWSVYNVAAQERIHSWDWHHPLKPMQAALSERTLPDDRVLYFLPEGADESSDNDLLAHYLDGLNGAEGRFVRSNNATPDVVYFEEVREIIGDGNRAWVSYENARRNWRIGPVEERILPADGFDQCGVVQDDTVYVSLWARAWDAAPPVTFAVDDDNAIPITVMNPPTLRADGTFEVSFAWAVPDTVFPGLHSLGVHIENAEGVYVTGVDFGLEPGAFQCHYVQHDVSDLSPGAYTVKMTAYEWQTDERLPPDAPADEAQRTVIGQFIVE